MVLKPGDSVKIDECEQVDNFPFSLLKDPDSLALDPGDTDLKHTPAFGRVEDNDLSQIPTGEFNERDLQICTENHSFQKVGEPLRLSLEKPDDDDEDPPDPSDPNLLQIGLVTFTKHEIRETEQSVIGQGAGEILHNEFPPPIYVWNTDMGNAIWDLVNPPGIIKLPLNYTGGGPFCSSILNGTVEITSLWNPATSTSNEVARVRVFGTHNLGPFSTFAGSGGVGLVQCSSDPITFKTGGFFVNFLFSTQRRWRWNQLLRCFPASFIPPPGLSFPGIIEDPTDPTGGLCP